MQSKKYELAHDVFLEIAAKTNSQKKDTILSGEQPFFTTFYTNYFFSRDKQALISTPDLYFTYLGFKTKETLPWVSQK